MNSNGWVFGARMCEGAVVAIAGAAAEGANPVSPHHRPCGRPPGYSVDKGPLRP